MSERTGRFCDFPDKSEPITSDDQVVYNVTVPGRPGEVYEFDTATCARNWISGFERGDYDTDEEKAAKAKVIAEAEEVAAKAKAELDAKEAKAKADADKKAAAA